MQADCSMNESELKEQLQGDLEMQGGELNPVGDLRVQEDVHRVLAYDLGPQEQAYCSVKEADLREQNVRWERSIRAEKTGTGRIRVARLVCNISTIDFKTTLSFEINLKQLHDKHSYYTSPLRSCGRP